MPTALRGRSHKSHLLWVDCSAGIAAGLLTLGLSGWLSPLYGLPQALIIGVGAANLLYGAYSLSLARRAQRPMRMIQLLAVANIGWALVCLMIVLSHWQAITGFGMAHLLIEGAFVGGLGLSEWRHRDLLRVV